MKLEPYQRVANHFSKVFKSLAMLRRLNECDPDVSSMIEIAEKYLREAWRTFNSDPTMEETKCQASDTN